MASYTCCSITLPVLGDAGDCQTIGPGIKEAAISCYSRLRVITETACPTAQVTDIQTRDVTLVTAGPSFYPIELRRGDSSQTWDDTYAEDSGVTTRTETITLITEVNSIEAMCAVRSYLGQRVAMYWKEHGLDGRYFLSGRAGDLYCTQVTGGTGTNNEPQYMTIVLSGADIQKESIQIFDTDLATTLALINTITV